MAPSGGATRAPRNTRDGRDGHAELLGSYAGGALVVVVAVVALIAGAVFELQEERGYKVAHPIY